MTSCSDVVSSIIRQRPGISSGGLWERNKPFHYSSKGLFKNVLALFPSTCACFLSIASLCCWRFQSCNMLLFHLPCKYGHNRWQNWAVAKSIATLKAVLRLSARDHGSLACKQTDGVSVPHLLPCKVYQLNLCRCRKPFGVTSLAEHEGKLKTLRWKLSFHQIT